MVKGYVIEYNVRCIKTGKKFSDSFLPSEKYGDSFTDTMQNAKVGDTSVAEGFEGRHYDENGVDVAVTYDQMFVVTEAWQTLVLWYLSDMNANDAVQFLRDNGYAVVYFEPSELKGADPRSVEEGLNEFAYGVIDALSEK